MRKKNKPYLEKRMKELIDSVKPNTGFINLSLEGMPTEVERALHEYGISYLNLNTKVPFLMLSVGNTKSGKFFLTSPVIETTNPVGNEYSYEFFDSPKALLQGAKDKTIRFLSLTGRNPVIDFTELEKTVNQLEVISV